MVAFSIGPQGAEVLAIGLAMKLDVRWTRTGALAAAIGIGRDVPPAYRNMPISLFLQEKAVGQAGSSCANEVCRGFDANPPRH